MSTITINEAGAQFTDLLNRVVKGEEIIISQDGYEVAKIIQVKQGKPKLRKLGLDRDKIEIADNFDDPLPADIQNYFQ